MKRLLSFWLILVLLGVSGAAWAEPLRDGDLKISAPSAVLMEKETGELLYEKGAHERRPPASVTKVMTLLLIVEDIESGKIALEDVVTASARAASFGGSCVYLEEGERMSVDEMLKCIAVVSANDCAVAMAEHLCGSEEVFVERMNRRAAELGMADTHFTNCTGLFEDPEHYTTAYDIALMSRELVRHELAKHYTTIWMDTIRGGAFGLSNTNKLVYWYNGCTGLKTGYTSQAMYCLAATAERDGVEYIAVIMHGDSIESRNADAKALLNYRAAARGRGAARGLRGVRRAPLSAAHARGRGPLPARRQGRRGLRLFLLPARARQRAGEGGRGDRRAHRHARRRGDRAAASRRGAECGAHRLLGHPRPSGGQPGRLVGEKKHSLNFPGDDV